MAHYLVVAHQTGASDELARALRNLARDGEASFSLVVPATPVEHLLAGWSEGEARAAAEAAATAAAERLAREGITFEDVIIGDAHPVYAVEDQMAKEVYDGVVVSTLAPGPSRWLRRDLVSRLRHALDVPVVHVTPAAVETP